MTINRQRAEMIAINGLQHLAGDEEQLAKFLQLTGYDPRDLRENAGSAEFLAGILEFFMANEPALLAFCAQHSLNPEDIGKAHQCLGGDPGYGVGEL